MKRKSVLILGVLVLAISLSGCFNLFKGIDKPNDNDKEVQDYKMTEILRGGGSGDYGKVTEIVDKKINDTPELKAIDDILGVGADSFDAAVSNSAIDVTTSSTVALDTADTLLEAKKDEVLSNYTQNKTAVDQYYSLMSTQTEADMGAAGINAFDLITELASTSSSSLSPSVSGNKVGIFKNVSMTQSDSGEISGLGDVIDRLDKLGLIFYKDEARYQRFMRLESIVEARLPSYNRIIQMTDVPTVWRDMYRGAALIKTIFYINFVLYNFDADRDGVISSPSFLNGKTTGNDDLSYYNSHKSTYFTSSPAILTKSPSVVLYKANKIKDFYKIVQVAFSLKTDDVKQIKTEIDKFYNQNMPTTVDGIFNDFIPKIAEYWN